MRDGVWSLASNYIVKISLFAQWRMPVLVVQLVYSVPEQRDFEMRLIQANTGTENVKRTDDRDLPMDLCPSSAIFWSKNVKKVHFCVIFASFPVIFFVKIVVYLLLSSLLYECITLCV